MFSADMSVFGKATPFIRLADDLMGNDLQAKRNPIKRTLIELTAKQSEISANWLKARAYNRILSEQQLHSLAGLRDMNT